MLPLALDLSQRDVLVIGMGRVGAHKARQMLDAGARVHVISDVLQVALPEGVASVRVRPFQPGDLAGYFLVVSATANANVNDQIVAEAEERHILLNVVDDPPRCSFYFTSVHRDGDVIVSVSSSGASPSLAQWVRRRVQALLPSGLGVVAQTLREERAALRAVGESTERDWSQRVEELTREL
jgi:uroporphyrin-III C-methyltransferase/precorrin-2 dehydrogenase/sirohydrochlorin ferrochelatase